MTPSPTCTYTPEPPGVPRPILLGLMMLSIAFFGANFSVVWRLMERYWPRFRTYDASQRGDNASRVNSTLHAILVCSSLLYALRTMEWGPFMEPLQSPWLFQVSLATSMGYFISDFFVLWRYHTPKWKIFMLHHAMAVMPYLVYLFVAPCNLGVRILAHYMLVELTNPTYNAQLWMKEVGNTRSKAYAALLYTSAMGWFVFRNCLPAWSVWLSHTVVIPNLPTTGKYLLAGLVCGYFVNLFCAVAFYEVFVKEIVERWQGKGSWALGEAYEARKRKAAADKGLRSRTQSSEDNGSSSKCRGRTKKGGLG